MMYVQDLNYRSPPTVLCKLRVAHDIDIHTLIGWVYHNFAERRFLLKASITVGDLWVTLRFKADPIVSSREGCVSTDL